MSNFVLPKLGEDAIALSHFPSRHQAFIFRAWEYVSAEKIAQILRVSVDVVRREADLMGLPELDVGDVWLTKGYITIIRRLWHVLPYSQLIELLETDEDELARTLREDDFLDLKLGDKPACEPVEWRELTPDERGQTAGIREIVTSCDVGGVAPFDFAYDIPKVSPRGNEVFKSRIIYAFSGLYQHAFDVDSREFLPDDQLKAYKALGINGIWTQGVLSMLAPYPFDASVSAGYEQRIERMRSLAQRLENFGIKLYLYINEPRSMPREFFNGRENIRGHETDGGVSLCTSTEAVQAYLSDSIEYICRSVPNIGGFFTITRSENQTNCYSHSGQGNNPCNCQRCKERGAPDVIADTLRCMLEGAQRVSRDIKVFAWNWRWDEFSEAIIRKLPRDIIFIAQSELDMPFEIGGVRGNVLDYSMSIVGPGELARSQWKVARECGLEIGAKVQINTTWEASTVPAIPVSPSVEDHVSALKDDGVSHLLLSWTLGGYPGRNLLAASKFFYEKVELEDKDGYYAAELQFVKAFRHFPFHIGTLYEGVQNAGPSNLLFADPTGYRATMTCFAYDDLDAWRSIYPVDTFEAQLEKLCQEWKKGLDMLATGDNGEVAVMARATYCLFKSSLDQVRFIRARDEHRYEDAIAAAKCEIDTAKMMLDAMNANAAIGYEAANHYYFSKMQLVEKVINCYHTISVFEKRMKE